jgi:hypothetical protein
MGSFGQTGSRETPPVCATHSPELAIGFVSKNGQLACSEKKIGGHTTAIMPSGPRPFSWGSGDPSEIMTIRSGTGPARGTDDFRTQHIRTGIGFVRGNRFAAERARFFDPSSRDRHWIRFVIRSLASFGEAAREVHCKVPAYRYGLSKNGGRKDSL